MAVASTHAYSTLHDYIAEAKRKGIKLFAITDHGPDMADAPHYWHFVNMRIETGLLISKTPAVAGFSRLNNRAGGRPDRLPAPLAQAG